MSSDCKSTLVKLAIPQVWPDLDWMFRPETPRPEVDAKDDAKNTLLHIPDIDVFYPIRSRGLRGWYQIKSWPASISTPSSTHATAADIPPELFEKILAAIHHGRAEWEVQFPGLNHAYFEKLDLGACAAVCRYWARLCQPKIFDHITMRSRQDVYTLLTFLQSPFSHISHYIESFVVQNLDPAAEPWIHHLSTLSRRLSKDIVIQVTIHGPLSAKQRVFRSLHSGLPRTLPYASTNIAYLNLFDVHLRCFADLIHLADESPNLRNINCTKLTWGPRSADLTRALRTSPEISRGITMSQCSEYGVSIFLSSFKWPQRELSSDDFYVMSALSHMVATATKAESSHCWISASASGRAGEPLLVDSFEVKYAYSWPNAVSDTSLELSFLRPFSMKNFQLLYTQRPKCATLHVQVMALELPRATAHGSLSWDKIDWKSFDERTRSLDELDTCIVGFQTREDMLHFAETIGRKPGGLFKSGRLKYAVKQKKPNNDVVNGDSIWMRAAPGSDVMTDSRSNQLAYAYSL